MYAKGRYIGVIVKWESTDRIFRRLNFEESKVHIINNFPLKKKKLQLIIHMCFVFYDHDVYFSYFIDIVNTELFISYFNGNFSWKNNVANLDWCVFGVFASFD